MMREFLAGKELEQEIGKQITNEWQKSIGGLNFIAGKQYPITIEVNGRKIQFAASKRTGGGTMTLEMLVETIYGFVFNQYKFGKEGVLVYSGSRNLFAHSEEAKKSQIDEYNSLFKNKNAG